MEDDENSPFRAITMKQDFIGSLEFTINADTENYKHSVLTSDQLLRFTYFKLAEIIKQIYSYLCKISKMEAC